MFIDLENWVDCFLVEFIILLRFVETEVVMQCALVCLILQQGCHLILVRYHGQSKVVQ